MLRAIVSAIGNPYRSSASLIDVSVVIIASNVSAAEAEAHGERSRHDRWIGRPGFALMIPGVGDNPRPMASTWIAKLIQHLERVVKDAVRRR